MILAIVGSRDLAGNETALSHIREILMKEKPDVVISGGADGIDSMAVEEAKAMGIPCVELKPQVMMFDPSGGMVGYRHRNWMIANACDKLYRIYSNTTKTYGSGYTADQAQMMGKEVVRIEVD